MAAPTHEDAQIMLRCAELYNSLGLNEVSRWIFDDDFPKTYAAFTKQNPPGSEGYNDLIKYASYFETLATLWKHGLFNQDLLLDWLLIPWPRVGALLIGDREFRGHKELWENFEALGEAQQQAR